MQENLVAKYGITHKELKAAIDQIKLGNIACSGSVLCALCDLVVNGDIKGDESQSKIIFACPDHERFYYTQIAQVRSDDCYHKAFVYALGITEDCRLHFEEIFDISADRIKTESLHKGWVTGTDARAMRLAFNLYTDGISEEGKEELYAVNRIFGYDCMQYFLQAIALRFA